MPETAPAAPQKLLPGGKARPNSKQFTARSYGLFVEAYEKTGGNFRRAAKAIGFSHEAVYSYLRKNPDLLDTLKRDIEAPCLVRILELGNSERDWRAFAWFLERTNPEKYALTEVHRVEHSGKVEHNVNLITESQLHELIAAIREVEVEICPA